ncbi:hypothetical protein JOQ06_023845 [Pogonophryne albipinna]|uniref:L1 transposable element RRM domain-containing protein n=1 Tax=Pogonophryne albipinna TaxID=1090488 RepID=A0AAD6FT84_9TELE|nr:hypothetical protein JOQ06_023845 [Pogonophryne albipinna]
MSGGVVTRGRERLDQQNGQHSKTMEQNHDEEQVQLAEANSLTLTMRSGLEAISKEIRNLKTEIKKDSTTLKEQVTDDVKSEINELKREMYQQLSANTKTLQAQGSRIAEAEGQIEETETWNMEVKDALCKSLKQQQILQDKLTDIEGRSRRNNIRIFGIPEDKEGDSAPKYVHQLLTASKCQPANPMGTQGAGPKTELQLATAIYDRTFFGIHGDGPEERSAALDHEASLERLHQGLPWQRVGERRDGTARRAKEKLQEFERITQDSE